MSIASTIFHIQGRPAEAVEAALGAIFAREERPRVLRLEGAYSATLARLSDPDLEAAYRYLILRPHGAGDWTPLLELGQRTVGLDLELSRALEGATVVTVYQYGEVVAGYRVTRAGAEVDRYSSDPTAFPGAGGAGDEGDDLNDAGDLGDTEAEPLSANEVASWRGRPERFADLLPAGTPPEEFWRVVLAPGWWERHADAAIERATEPEPEAGTVDDEDDEDDETLVDEVDRMRCIALALELWAADEYPLTQELEELPNRVAGPAIVLAWA